jgi:dihydroneopterin triphosphate diphosphatase
MPIKDLIAFVPVFVGFIDHKIPVQLSPAEHDAYKWLTFEKAVERLIFAEQKRILSHIHQNFVLKNPHAVNLIS